ncbi:uncharacterized protein LOC127861062 isoform X2 [Dreissena polymorpha]|uniref:uncharacterized protein LOC127861062 isoform X2 n=1 Tax=Dreissena polymorpha TaxID=45954 RepID=UPI0022649F2C|nr:uncharacterized protein LOC127861062 isoform X2 [Dreissena polymorpha]
MTLMENAPRNHIPAPSVSKVTLFPPLSTPNNNVTYQHATHDLVTTQITCGDTRDQRAKTALPRGVSRSSNGDLLGNDIQLYPSSQWRTENKSQFAGEMPVGGWELPRGQPDFVITSIDNRRHNPQSRQVFHIKRFNKKPVCSLQWIDNGKGTSGSAPEPPGSVYRVSYQETPGTKQPQIVHKRDMDRPIDGSIVPVNIMSANFDIRSEMMLPVCDSTAMPSAHNPHRYLLRKRKVAPPYRIVNGIVNPPREEIHQVPRPPRESRSKLPAGICSSPDGSYDRTCVSSLSGYAFTRRKYIPPPANNILTGFDGGVPESTSMRFNEKYGPFMRAKTII